MFDVATLTKTMVADAAQGVEPPSWPNDSATVNEIFAELLGMYGNLFLNKWSSGETNHEGQDSGIENARSKWACRLNVFSEQVICAALDRCIEIHPKYPPSLPEFIALCRANQPRVTFAEQCLALPDLAARSKQAAQIRELRDRISSQSASEVSSTPSQGLSKLKVLIAQAAALAGGDEAAVLHDLEVMLAPGKPLENAFPSEQERKTPT